MLHPVSGFLDRPTLCCVSRAVIACNLVVPAHHQRSQATLVRPVPGLFNQGPVTAVARVVRVTCEDDQEQDGFWLS